MQGHVQRVGQKRAPRGNPPGVRARSAPTTAILVAERRAVILRCYAAGDTVARIGRRVGLKPSRVVQIVERSGVAVPHRLKCAVEDCETVPRAPNRYCSRHRVRLERFGDPLWKRPAVNDEHGTMVKYIRDRCRCTRCRRCNAERSTKYLHRVHPEMGYRSPHKDSGGERGSRTASYYEERTATIMRDYAGGATLAQIGATVGLTRERVRQIVKGSGALTPRDGKCGVQDCQTAPRPPNRYCHPHRRRLGRLDDPRRATSLHATALSGTGSQTTSA
jgi:Sigma-70, region 4